MILGLIEDYQKIITTPETCSNVLVALSELIKYILDTKMEMINYELMERRKSGEVSCYIVALKEHISKLEVQNNKLWDSVNGSSDFETVFETEPGSPGDSTGLLAEIQSENMKKIQTYRENNAMLESARTELERVSLGYPPVPNFPKSLKVDECLAKIEEMQIQMDSVVNKMTENIGYNHSLIEQLNVKYTVLSNQIQELENRAASTPNDLRSQTCDLRVDREAASTQTDDQPNERAHDLLAYSVVQTKFDKALPYPSTPSGGALYGGSVPPNFVPFLKRGVHCPPPGFSYPPQGVRPQHRTVPATPPRRNKDKYNKNKERNELLKKHKDLRDKKE